MKKIHKEILLVVVFLAFITYAFSLWTFAGIIGKDQGRAIVRDFERAYLYQNALSNPSYAKLRTETLSGVFTTKRKIETLMTTAFKMAGDQESEISYIDLLQGKVKKSEIERLQFKKKVIDDTAYVKINVFNTKLMPLFEKTLDGYAGKEKNLILDFKGAGSGDILIAAALADDFISDGKEVCTLEGAVASNVIKSDVFAYDFQKIFVFLDKDSGAPAEMVALSLQQNLGDKVVLVGNSTKQATTAFSDRKYSVHLSTSVAAFKWTVNGYNSAALQSLLVKGNYPPLASLEDYMKQVK